MNELATDYIKRINHYIPNEERRSYSQTSIWQTLFVFGHIWLGLIVSFYLVYLLQLGPLWLQVCVAPFLIFYIGSRINAFGVQVHEASHYLLMPWKALNYPFCNIFGGYWILNDVASYWGVHKRHHSHLHDATDPDLDLYLLPNQGRLHIILVLLKDLFWIGSIQRIFGYLKNRDQESEKKPSNEFLFHNIAKVVAQLIVLSLFLTTFGFTKGCFLYFVYWLIPLFSVFSAIVRIRISTEHYSDLLHEKNRLPLFVSRTSAGNFLEEYLIGASMEYHLEHHLFPNIPHYQLKKLHRELMNRGFFNEFQNNINDLLSGGYFHFWKKLLSPKAEVKTLKQAV